MAENEPLSNGASNGEGRDVSGRFSTGNRVAVGHEHPHARIAAERRAEFWKSIRASDVRQAVRTIRRIMRSKTAKDADRLAAARELLDRVIGKAGQEDVLKRIEELEAIAARRHGAKNER